MAAQDRRPETTRRPYHPPRLLRFGTLRDLTQSKGGSGNDGGGKPRTRASGKFA